MKRSKAKFSVAAGWELDGAKIRAARERLGHSQEQQAAIAGITRPSYARIESGARPNPNLSTALRVARSLGAAIEDLLADS